MTSWTSHALLSTACSTPDSRPVLDVLDFANAMADEVPGRGTGVVSSAMREQVDELGGTLAALVME